jgi:GT2 family glycosyltransferase
MSTFAGTSCSVLVSILNWNGAIDTTGCVKSLLAMTNTGGHRIEILVIDNGSRPDDWEALRDSLYGLNVRLVRQEQNLGFAGGHNVALDMALQQKFDFTWLVNNDSLVKAGTLDALVARMVAEPQCGIVSPVVLAMADETVIDFCGARHDWKNLASISCTSVEEARAMEQTHPADMWLMGAAIMLRMDAVREVGVLDHRYFAYYEDNDISARMSAKGWLCRMAFDAVVLHDHPVSRLTEKGAYYFYLMARNSFRFWYQHTPQPYRRLLRLKLIDRATLMANRLHSCQYDEKAAACLLGIYDSQTGRSGKWNLERRVPVVMTALRKLLWRNHVRHFVPGQD